MLAIVKTCERGSAPPNTLVKLIGFTWVRIGSPTTTLTGTVTVVPPPENTSCPMNVPVVIPPPGRFATVIPTVIKEGAAPLVLDTVSQFAPSEVLFVRVQFSVPLPPLRT